MARRSSKRVRATTPQPRPEREVTLPRPNARDPMERFPPELLALIFSHLDYRQHVQLLQVSQLWNRMLLGLPSLTSTINFRNATAPITPSMLSAAFRRCRNPTTIKAAHLTDRSMDSLLEKLQDWHMFRAFRSLEVADGMFMAWMLPLGKYDLRDISISEDTAVTLEWICNTLLVQCPMLQAARFDKVTRERHCREGQGDVLLQSNILQEVTLHMSKDYKQRHISLENSFFGGVPQLRKLRCSGIGFISSPDGSPMDLRHLAHLEHLSFVLCHSLNNFYLPPSIQVLEIMRCAFVLTTHRLHASLCFPSLDNLRILRLHIYDAVPVFLQQAAAKTKPGTLLACDLRTTVTWTVGRAVPVLPFLSRQWFSGLQELHLSSWHGMNYVPQYTYFKSFWPNLREVGFSYGVMLTDRFVQEMLEDPGSMIKKLAYSYAESDEAENDSMELANKRGVELISTEPCHTVWQLTLLGDSPKYGSLHKR